MSYKIFFYVPNLIGYFRILLALIAFYNIQTRPSFAISSYALSMFLDWVDGYAARYFKQSSMLGAMLDLISDKCTSSGLIVALAHIYPDWMFILICILMLDIASHWMFLHTVILKGYKSHKTINYDSNIVLRIYYKPVVLFSVVAGNEIFFSSLYIVYYYNYFFVLGFSVWECVMMISMPLACMKHFAHFAHLVEAFKNFIDIDAKISEGHDNSSHPKKSKKNK